MIYFTFWHYCIWLIFKIFWTLGNPKKVTATQVCIFLDISIKIYQQKNQTKSQISQTFRIARRQRILCTSTYLKIEKYLVSKPLSSSYWKSFQRVRGVWENYIKQIKGLLDSLPELESPPNVWKVSKYSR